MVNRKLPNVPTHTVFFIFSSFTSADDAFPCEPSEFVRRMVAQENSELFLLQLPASLANFKAPLSRPEPKEEMLSPKKEPDAQPPTAQASSEVGQSACPTPAPPQAPADGTAACPHCMDGLSGNLEVGRLQLLRNGKTRLVVGGRPMDLQQAIPSSLHEASSQGSGARMTRCSGHRQHLRAQDQRAGHQVGDGLPARLPSGHFARRQGLLHGRNLPKLVMQLQLLTIACSQGLIIYGIIKVIVGTPRKIR